MYLASEFSHLEAGIQFKNGGFTRNIFMQTTDFIEWMKSNHEHGLFTTAYRYDSENIREANMLGHLYIDFDVTDIDLSYSLIREDTIRTISAFTAIFGIPKDMMRIYFSGSKGFHLILPLEVLGVEPHQELNRVFGLIAKDMNKLTKNKTIDTGIYDNVRLFRVPNSRHPESGLYKIELSMDELVHCSLEELKNLARQPRKRLVKSVHKIMQAKKVYDEYVDELEEDKKREIERRKKGRTGTLNFTPPCVAHILDEGTPQGQRNNTAAALASHFLQRGHNEEQAMKEMHTWNAEKCDPPLATGEIERTVQSIYRTEVKYGCARMRELSICDPSCRIYKK